MPCQAHRCSQPKRQSFAKRGIDVDGDLDSINAMTPDPSTLMAVNASDGTSDAPLANQALQRWSVTTESATLAAQATAIPSCFNALIAGDLHPQHPALIDSAISLTG
jgi:hypothetical protein